MLLVFVLWLMNEPLDGAEDDGVVFRVRILIVDVISKVGQDDVVDPVD